MKDIIIVISDGILDNPLLVDSDKANAAFDNIAGELLGEDYEELKSVDYGFRLEELNNLLKGTGKEVHWFCDYKI